MAVKTLFNQVMILGMHRSGTSAVAGLVHSCGYEFGENLICPASDNPKGFWEDRDLVALNDRLLGGPIGWRYITPPEKFTEEISNEAYRWYHRLKNRSGMKFAFKDPRLCRLLDFWLKILDTSKVIFVLRDPRSVAASLHNRNNMEYLEAVILWISYNYEAARAVYNHNLDYHVIDYDLLINEYEYTATEISKFIDAPISDRIAVDPMLRHYKHSNETIILPKTVSELADGIKRTISSGNLSAIKDFEQDYQEMLSCYSFIDRIRLEYEDNRKEAATYQSHLEKDIAQLKISCENERSRAIELEIALQDEKKRYDELTAEKVEIEKIRWEIDDILHSVYSSKSWRLTKPLRAVNEFCRFIYHSFPGRLFWTVLAIIRRIRKRFLELANSTQSSKAINELVSYRKFVNPVKHTRQPETKIKEWPEITVSVVTYNNGDWLYTFMASLMKQDYPLNKIHLIFVDNSSSDDTLLRLRKFACEENKKFASFIVESRPNNGFGAGHDFAIHSSTTDFVLVSNIDLEFVSTSITRVVAVALGDTESASWELRQIPYEHPKFVDPVSLRVNWSSHACILLSRVHYLKAGGYEKRIFMYGEDVELSYRFRQFGYNLRYVPSAVVKHFSYEETSICKPIQFKGSVVANYLIRLRYGNKKDILAGMVIITALLLKKKSMNSNRLLLHDAMNLAIKRTPAFLAARKKSSAFFPFHGFDYDLTRDGAFYKCAFLDNKHDVPLVTVITRTTSGRQGLLRQCMLSVINQTYPSIEHLIVEDGGNTTVAIVHELQESAGKGYNAQHFALPKKGRSYAGNYGLYNANGRYIMFLDDDDLLFPDHIEVLYQALIDNLADAAYGLAWDTPVKNLDKEEGYYHEIDHFTLPLFYQSFDREVLIHHNYLPIQSVLFGNYLFERYGGFDEDLTYLEDWVLWKKYAKSSKFVFVPKTTSMYKTPGDIGEMMRRKATLDGAYAVASSRPSKSSNGTKNE